MRQKSGTINKKRIAVNTLILYIRMFLLMLSGFYTVRLLLAYLGVEDYGLYNVIFGLVVSFSFFSNAMLTTVQRFLCHGMSSSPGENLRKYFSASVFLFLLLAAVFFILAETAGLWFVCHKMTIPPDRMQTALTIYHISIWLVIMKLLRMPYVAVLTSNENMQMYSWLSILDALLYLASVLALKFISAERLIAFVLLFTLSSFIVLLAYIFYCTKKYSMCRIGFKPEYACLKEMTSFFSWNLLGSVANVLKQQGINLLLNLFFGVILNATWGIAVQAGNAISQFYNSFQQAFNPQILKSCNNADKETFYALLRNCSKYSFLLIWLVSLPILLQTEFLLKLWLGNKMPEEAVIFTRLMLIYVIADAICSPLWVAVQASGKIKRYQIEISLLLSAGFVLSWIAFFLGAPAWFAAAANAFVNFLTLGYRLLYLRKTIGFPVRSYIRKTLLPMLAVTAVSCAAGILLQPFFSGSWYMKCADLAIITLINMAAVLFLGLSGSEKTALWTYAMRKLHR